MKIIFRDEDLLHNSESYSMSCKCTGPMWC